MAVPPDVLYQEETRLTALRRYRILDTAPETAFDDLTTLASYICGTPAALISFVDADRVWLKSKQGLHLDEVSREDGFCSVAIAQSEDFFLVPDATLDERFARTRWLQESHTSGFMPERPW